MTLPVLTTGFVVVGAGAATPIPLSSGSAQIRFRDRSHIHVEALPVAGVASRLVEGSDYDITGTAPTSTYAWFDNAFVVPLSAIPVGVKWAIWREQPIEQTFDPTVSGALDSQLIESTFDRQCEIDQEIADNAARAIKFSRLSGTAAAPDLLFDPIADDQKILAMLDGDVKALPGNGANSLVGLNSSGQAYLVPNTLPALVPLNDPGGELPFLTFVPEAQWAAILAGTSTYDATAAFQSAITSAHGTGKRLALPNGKIRITGPITIPCGTGGGHFRPVSIIGQGKGSTIIEIDGTGCPLGLHVLGEGTVAPPESASYKRAPKLADFTVLGVNGATRGITVQSFTQVCLDRIIVKDFEGHGVSLDTGIMPIMNDCLLLNCGTASLAQMLVLHCTTINFSGVYWAGARAGCISNIDFEGGTGGVVNGGAVETCNRLFRIGADPAYAATPPNGLTFVGWNIENPDEVFGEIGTGTASGLGPQNIEFANCNLSASELSIPAIPIQHALIIQNSNDIKIHGFAFSACTVSNFEILGTCTGIVIEQQGLPIHGTVPYVRVNGVHRKDATPLVRWHMDHKNYYDRNVAVVVPFVGTTVSVSPNAAQGGAHRTIYLNNAAPTNLTQILDGFAEEELIVIAVNAAVTLVHNVGLVTDYIKTKSGANTVMAGNREYKFRRLSGWNMWFEM